MSAAAAASQRNRTNNGWRDKVLYPLVVASILGAFGVYALAAENKSRSLNNEKAIKELKEDVVRRLERIEDKVDLLKVK